MIKTSTKNNINTIKFSPKRISFNKGRTFYRIDTEATTEDITFVLNKLNKKTWNRIVNLMDDKILENGINLDESKMVKPEDYKTSCEYTSRFNILRTYLYNANRDLIL